LAASTYLFYFYNAQKVRVVNGVNLGLGILALISQIASHILFTYKVEELTGQSFGSMWGLI